MTTTESVGVNEAARQAFRAGLAVVPIKEDGSKRPDLIQWTQFQAQRPDANAVRNWYAQPRAGIGILTGRSSGNVECIDFDDESTYLLFRDTAESLGMGDLIERIEAGYLERTPSGGRHWLYRCDDIAGNQKLAQRPITTISDDGQERPGRKALIETRGQGGFVVLAPSSGSVHQSGQPYVLLRGGYGTIATITPAERSELHALARALDETPDDPAVDAVPRVAADSDDRRVPGVDFNARATWAEVLEPHGWTLVRTLGERAFWRHPDAHHRWSASTNWNGSNLLYVWSGSTPFRQHEGYSLWRAYAVLNHDSDWSAAARDLKRQGYGDASHEPGEPIRATLGGRTLEDLSSGPPADGAPGEGTPAPRYPFTDTGNAERLIAAHGDNLRFSYTLNRWLHYDAPRWVIDDGARIDQLAKDVVRGIPAEPGHEKDDADEHKARLKWALASEKVASRAALITLARSERPIDVDALDRDPWLLTVANGVIDLRTGALRGATRDDYSTKWTPVVYDPDAAAPRWRQFLDEVTADAHGNPRPELAAFLQRAAGYSLTGAISERVVFILHGSGANGKSTFQEVLMDLCGDFALRIATESLMVKKGDSIPNDIARLRGARLVAASESDEGRRLSEALIKQLTGGDTISARFMRAEWFDFRPQFKVWLATNHKPLVRGTDNAIWDRLRLIPFDVRFPPGDRDQQLLEKLRAELPGILAWAVQGCLQWQESGLQPPEVVMAATEEYRAEMDVLGGWLADRCTLGPRESAPATALYLSYQRWAEAAGEHVMSQTALGRRLTERGFDRKRAAAGQVWHGLSITPTPSDNPYLLHTPHQQHAWMTSSARFGGDSGAQDDDTW